MLTTAVNSADEALAVASTADEADTKIGYFTDVHYADADAREGRNYRGSLPKIEQAVEKLNFQRLNFVVHGGDLIDALPTPTPESELAFLKRIDQEFCRINAERHYVLGNHCIYSLTKPEYLDKIGRHHSYYSFDTAGFHFVVLDACFRKDGVAYGRRNFNWTDTEVPPEQREWLASDLRTARLQTIVFVHQRLDVATGEAVHSSSLVREILEQSGTVRAVFMGHSHVNDYRLIKGIHYCTLAAVVGGDGPANNAYSVIDVFRDGTIKLNGFCKHAANPLCKLERV